MRRSLRIRATLGVALVLGLSTPSAADPQESAGAPWRVDATDTIAYPNWLHAGPHVRNDVKSILSSEVGNLQYWIRAPKGAKGQVVVAVGEAHWSEPGHRIMDVVIDGNVRARRIHPIAHAGGQHRVAVVLCDAEDLNGDGQIHVRIVASEGTPDHVTLAAGIWWFSRGTLTSKQAAELLKPDCELEPDVFIPGGRTTLPARDRLRGRVETENVELNELVERLYADCVLGKLYPPRLPALPHPWFSPGGGYVGQWVWDTMFVGIAYAPLDDDVTLRGVFDNYWHTIDRNPEAPKGSYRFGMVPNFLKDWPPHGYSQIPILAWGCELIWRQTNDRELIERCLPYLVIFDEWYSTERDTDGDGLIEYGAYKQVGNAGMLQTARYETFDLHVTLDDMKMTTHPKRETGGEWYGNVEGVEQTCFLLMSEEAIVRMARALRQDELAQRFERIVESRIAALQKNMWDSEQAFFYSLDRDTNRKIPVRTIQGFLTMACGAATEEQAAALAEQLRDPKRWWSECPVPTCAMDEEKFDPRGFWRGDMWPPTTYLVSYGLNRYGYHDLARQLTDKLWRLAAEKGINERYESTTGEPLGVPWLGMSCSIWSMIVQNVYGVQEDFRTIRVPPNAKGRRLLLGKLEVSYPEDDVVELRTAFERELRVVFPARNGGKRPNVSTGGATVHAVSVETDAVTFRAAPDVTYTVVRSE